MINYKSAIINVELLVLPANTDTKNRAKAVINNKEHRERSKERFITSVFD